MDRKLFMMLASVGVLAPGQMRLPDHPERNEDPKLPDGTSQKEAILKADHKRTLEDADALVRMAEDLKIDLEKNDRHVLSLATLKKLDEIDKLTKRIRGRMKRL